MKKTRLEKGITLIALIITIIILLILAVVTIGSIKESKIIDHAQNAASGYTVAQEEEKIMLGYSEYKIASIQNPDAKLEIEGAKSVIKTKGWTIEFESGNSYKLSPDGIISDYEPVVNEDPNGWDIAYIHNGTSWVDNHVTTEQELEGAKIVAKFYKQTLTEPIQPGSLIIDPSNPITFDPSNEAYTLYIEGTGDMGTLASFSENGIPIGAYGYQSGANALFGGTSTETFLMPYVTKIVICDGITNIGEGAFSVATSLQELTISETVETIGNSAFVFNDLDQIVIPGNITTIGARAFEHSQAESLVIEEGVEIIEDYAFFSSTLTSVIIQEGVEIIGKSAFSSSTLTSVIIPSSVRNVGDAAFCDCSMLKEVYVYTETCEFGARPFEYMYSSRGENEEKGKIYLKNMSFATSIGSGDDYEFLQF